MYLGISNLRFLSQIVFGILSKNYKIFLSPYFDNGGFVDLLGTF